LKNIAFKYIPRFILYPLLQIIHKYIMQIFRSQSNESEIIDFLVQKQSKFFIEFGIGPTEFNCSKLSTEGKKGILIDSNWDSIKIAKKILNKSTEILCMKLKPKDLLKLKQKIPPAHQLIVSIDVDGNDFEFFEYALKKLEPDLIVCEFNPTFGNKRIKVPFNHNFDRFLWHNYYHGVSLNSLVDAAHQYNYCLTGVSSNMFNAFFMQSNTSQSKNCDRIRRKTLSDLDSSSRSLKSLMTQKQQFTLIKNLPFDNLGKFKKICPN